MSTTNLNLEKLSEADIVIGDSLNKFKNEYNGNIDILDAIGAGVLPVTSISANYTVSPTADCVIEVKDNASVGILGASVSTGKYFVIANTGAGIATVSGGGMNINGAANLVVSASITRTVIKATSTLVAY